MIEIIALICSLSSSLFIWLCSIFTIHSFIHLGYFYSASSSPLLLRGAADTARILGRNFTPNPHRQLLVKNLLKAPPYVAARVAFELPTLQMKGNESTNEPTWHNVLCQFTIAV